MSRLLDLSGKSMPARRESLAGSLSSRSESSGENLSNSPDPAAELTFSGHKHVQYTPAEEQDKDGNLLQESFRFNAPFRR
jgi:hypothetical protein